MRKIGVVALAALVLLAGCDPKAGGNGGGGGGGGQQPQGSPDFLVAVDALDPDNRHVRREVVCTIIGYAANGQPFEVVDEKTKARNPYTLTINERTSARIRIKNYAGVVRIDVVCTMFGRKGEAVLCEFLDANGRRPAPLLEERSYGDAVYEKGTRTYLAHCSAAINAAT